MWSNEAQVRINKKARSGADILIVEKTLEDVNGWNRICRSLGYKAKSEPSQTESRQEWFQWWYKPKKRQPRIPASALASKVASEVSPPEDAITPEGNGPLRKTDAQGSHKFSARREGLVPLAH